MLSVSPSRWNGSEDPVPVVTRDAGAGVDDAQLDAVADGARLEQRRRPEA